MSTCPCPHGTRIAVAVQARGRDQCGQPVDQFHRREAQLGFEDFFARLAAGGLGPHDPAALASFAARYRLEFLGPSPFAG